MLCKNKIVEKKLKSPLIFFIQEKIASTWCMIVCICDQDCDFCAARPYDVLTPVSGHDVERVLRHRLAVQRSAIKKNKGYLKT